MDILDIKVKRSGDLKNENGSDLTIFINMFGLLEMPSKYADGRVLLGFL